ncbi:hypothetical protein PTRA_a0437 [Pseudoalteromonas translucida KMM 520]|uniref:Oligosaccharide repeat unit polymerase n=1 Tax=Pseudoalteromonas translucida KMM 520 TaxID=1315283 RepID=A0A0U2NE38_9GAMM|nr:O-antigen polymerase [Pseudoalteromonas translucida]ALS31795.1 hypothetical protein PTRA_a0437 [Pseudoalteromonas translucida KMM 520]
MHTMKLTNLAILFLLICHSLYAYATITHDVYFDVNTLSSGMVALMLVTFLLAKVDSSYINVFSLFLLSLSLFIGGRYIYNFLGGEENIFKISFFTFYTLETSEFNRLTVYVSSMFIYLLVGWSVLSKSKSDNKNKRDALLQGNNESLILFASIIISLLYLYSEFLLFINVISGGYLALYASQGGEFSFSLNPKTPFFILLALSLAFNVKKSRKVLLIALSISGLLGILMGQRGQFFTMVFFFVWYYSTLTNFNFTSILKSLLIAVPVSLVMMSLSFRSFESSASIYESIIHFLYSNGISLMVFDASTKIDDYPLLPGVQSFVIGASKVLSLFQDFPSYTTSYSGYISWFYNSKAYFSGQGLGWSLPSSFYVWSSGNIYIYNIFFILFGMQIRFINNVYNRSPFWFGLSVCFIYNLFFVGRSQLSDIYPICTYYIIAYFLYTRFCQVKKVW